MPAVTFRNNSEDCCGSMAPLLIPDIDSFDEVVECAECGATFSYWLNAVTYEKMYSQERALCLAWPR